MFLDNVILNNCILKFRRQEYYLNIKKLFNISCLQVGNNNILIGRLLSSVIFTRFRFIQLVFKHETIKYYTPNLHRNYKIVRQINNCNYHDV